MDRTPARGWHVSPLVDIAAYHLSWLWLLGPLLLVGGDKPSDWLALWAFGITVSFVHRHFTMPYVYLDAQVYGQHPSRFSLLAALLAAGFIAMAYTWRWKATGGFLVPADFAVLAAAVAVFAQAFFVDKAGAPIDVRTRVAVLLPYGAALALGISGAWSMFHAPTLCVLLVAFTIASAQLAVGNPRKGFVAVVVAIALFGLVSIAAGAPALNERAVLGRTLLAPLVALAAVWNVWHTLMQKYGILRVYAAKSSAPVERRTPGWVDRLLIFSWFPLLAVQVGTSQRELILKYGHAVKQYLAPTIDFLVVARPFLLVPSVALVAFAIGAFVHFERRSGIVSWPRLSMALALLALHACFLVAHPVKVYLAYGFSHAIEYMVFVWAFQRRRYAQELPHKPLMGRLLRRPLLWYAGYAIPIGALYFFLEFGDDYGLRAGRIDILGVSAPTWIFSFAIWHSIAHFWYDGFLWKMRLSSVRASL